MLRVIRLFANVFVVDVVFKLTAEVRGTVEVNVLKERHLYVAQSFGSCRSGSDSRLVQDSKQGMVIVDLHLRLAEQGIVGLQVVIEHLCKIVR